MFWGRRPHTFRHRRPARPNTNDGVDLSHIQAHALAGRWYRWKVARHQDAPGAADRWSKEIGALIAGLAGLLPKEVAKGLSASGARPAPERLAELLDTLTETQGRVLDRLAAAALVPDFLAQERVILSAAGRRRFLAALVQELMAANALLIRRAKGDYSPDPRPARLSVCSVTVSHTHNGKSRKVAA